VERGKRADGGLVTLYAGIDPGTKGAIVIIDDSKTIIDKLPFMRKGGDSLVIEWECGVMLLDDTTILNFLGQYQIESVAIECPAVTMAFGNGISGIAGLRGLVTQLYQMLSPLNATRRFVYPQTWQAANKIPRLKGKHTATQWKKHVIAEFESRYPDHGCKYGYELEGVADAWFIARWGMIQSKLDMGEVA
jgi:hypothetical protein